MKTLGQISGKDGYHGINGQVPSDRSFGKEIHPAIAILS
jgi:hypothetical protein